MKAREGKAAHKRAGGNGATAQAAAQAERRRWESAGGIKQAVKEWCEDGAAALAKYGHISDWDVSGVRDMRNLFQKQANFCNLRRYFAPAKGARRSRRDDHEQSCKNTDENVQAAASGESGGADDTERARCGGLAWR